MKIGDLVRVRLTGNPSARIGTILSEFRHGINASFCEVLLGGSVVTVTMATLERVSEDR